MKLGIAGGVLAVLAVIAAIVGYSSLFTVYQTRLALVVRLGQPVRVVTEPGLNFKMPLIDSVIYVDKRILDLENAAQEVIASDQKRLVVDAFARYRINDALLFYQSVGSIEGANSRLSTLLNAALRRVLGESTLTHVVRDDRAALMARVREQARPRGGRVRHHGGRRAHPPRRPAGARTARPSIERMKTERKREATEFRAQGSQRAQEIRARADRDVTVLVADAQSQGRYHARRGRGGTQPHLRRSLRQGPGLLRLLSLDAGLRVRAAATTTPAWCCGRTATSSAISPIRPASRAKTAKK